MTDNTKGETLQSALKKRELTVTNSAKNHIFEINKNFEKMSTFNFNKNIEKYGNSTITTKLAPLTSRNDSIKSYNKDLDAVKANTQYLFEMKSDKDDKNQKGKSFKRPQLQ